MTLYSRVKRKGISIYSKICSYFQMLRLRLNGVSYGDNVSVRGKIYIYNYGEIYIGNNVRINSALWSNPISAASHTCFQVMGGVLKIGSGTGISNTAITCQEKITIGENVMIGADCRIYDTDFHPIDSEYRYGLNRDDKRTRHREVIIEDGVFIGGGSIILKGSHIGKDSVVGAGSVVAGNIPAGEIWAGNPARFLRKVCE